MQKRSSGHLPLAYRPYDFPASFPVLAFLGDYWINGVSVPEFLHFHNGIEIGCCLGGTGQIYCGESDSFPYEPGDYSVIFPQVSHITVNDSAPSVWEYLYAEPKLLFQEEGSGCNALWQYFYIPQKLPVIIRREEFPILHLYLSGIFQEFHEKKALYQRSVHGLFVALCAEMNRLTLTEDVNDGSPKDSACEHHYVRSALAYIYEHYTEAISIQDLAAHCGICESHFRRVFKRVVGISPLEYIQHYRIQQACHLIYLNQESISIIAQQTGYRSLSSFNRQFQQYMHSSPTHYRREHLLAPQQNEVLSYEDSATKHIFQI
ncbi:MAG: AraC family transcriptional regulator [Lachnospiraceae bacterium]|nr:AraC family transcriptional regulator [Muribaculaceae bacterium]MCM1411278.1 AraC family transcriptional regulator [Lachnospiraceae bacterium]